MHTNTAENQQTDNTAAVPPEITEHGQELDQQSVALLELAESFVIDGDEMYEAAGHELNAVVARKKAITEERLNITRPMDAAKKRVMDFFKTPLDRLEKAEKALKRAMSTYYEEQERKRLEAQRKAEEEARAEAERQERERQERLAKAKAEADAKETELLEQAEKLATEVSPRAADQFLMEHELEARFVPPEEPDPASAVPAAAIPEKPKAAGVSHRKTWKARVTDKRALLQAVLDGKAPESLILVDEKKLGQLARSLGQELAYPGVEVYPEAVVAAGRR